ncbi:hypothetical protein A6R68_17377 [Neotoma lepida]|uniref:Anaphase-promoting complex subunit 4 WD40 domain-containing protein n=1 Tax=Neotoma lepida TaxID=56216 RepID=A0A1A6HD29_NEOLE|nr:hypothetical protein A6R68_17377 [Neotoma lepida]
MDGGRLFCLHLNLLPAGLVTSRIYSMTSYSQSNGAVGEILPSSFSKRYSSIMEKLPEELNSILSEMMTQLDSISSLVENFFQLMEIFSRSPGILEAVKVSIHPGAGGSGHQSVVSCDSRGPTGSVQAIQVSAEKEAKQGPEAAAPENPKLKANPGPQPSSRPQCLSETEEQQDPQPVWDKEPQFWRDTLTWELWKLFTDSQDNQQAQREGYLQVGLAVGLGYLRDMGPKARLTPFAVSLARDLEGPVSAAKSLVVKDDNVWTGGLDACLRCWDLRTAKVLQEHTFQSQIMTLSHSPREEWLLLGLANGQHCLYNSRKSEALTVGTKDKTILDLKFSPNGQWWVSVGMDDLVTIHSMPTGAKLFQVPEAATVTCCDVTANGRLIVTGSGDCASVYEIKY